MGAGLFPLQTEPADDVSVCCQVLFGSRFLPGNTALAGSETNAFTMHNDV